MPSENQTMQIRKFLKRVGVESHAALDEAIAKAGSGQVRVEMTLKIEGGATAEQTFTAEIDGD